MRYWLEFARERLRPQNNWLEKRKWIGNKWRMAKAFFGKGEDGKAARPHSEVTQEQVLDNQRICIGGERTRKSNRTRMMNKTRKGRRPDTTAKSRKSKCSITNASASAVRGRGRATGRGRCTRRRRACGHNPQRSHARAGARE